MRVAFLLPGWSPLPIGGFKAVYQFANGLAERGHHVSVLHLDPGETPPGFVARVRRRLPVVRGWRDPERLEWFPVHRAVELRRVPAVSADTVPDGDAIVNACWHTAPEVSRLPGRKGRKLWLVADYEYWSTADAAGRAAMARAFRAPEIELIAYGPSVAAMLATCGRRPVAEVHVGADLGAFAADKAIEDRPFGSIGFPARIEAFKGTADAIAAACMLRARYEGLTIQTFGRIHPISIPHWIRYWHKPTDDQLRAFYNELAIFVLPSHYEAWPLPGLEAMACGAALVAADSGGVRGYASHGEDALVVAKERPDLLADAIGDLLADESLRRRLARRGLSKALSLRWSDAVSVLESVLVACPAGSG